MRKQFVRCDSPAEAEEICPWAAEIIEADGGGSAGAHAHGYWCFESMTDANLFSSQAYRPSAVEIERSELQGDRIAMFRSEY